MVLEAARGKAVGPMLVAKAKQDLPFNLSLGQTERVAPLERLVFVVRGVRVLAGKLPAPLTTPAGAFLALWQQLRYWRGRRRLTSAFEVREVVQFGEAHDRLWARVEPDYPVAVVRDASYLNWKYVEQPGQSFIRFEIAANGEALAVVVLSISEPDHTYRYRRAWLTEIVVPPANNDLIWATLETVRKTCMSRNVDLIVFDVISEPLVHQAIAFGFMRRKPSRTLLIATVEPPTESGELALDGRNWLVTRGDSDIDRPWRGGDQSRD
jgi:hypothetical protein